MKTTAGAAKHYFAAYKVLQVNFTEYLPFHYMNHEPIDYSFSFVWPSKNIRRSMRVYVEFNHNLQAQWDAKQQELIQAGEWIAKVPGACICRWVDGKIYKPYMGDVYVLVVE